MFSSNPTPAVRSLSKEHKHTHMRILITENSMNHMWKSINYPAEGDPYWRWHDLKSPKELTQLVQKVVNECKDEIQDPKHPERVRRTLTVGQQTYTVVGRNLSNRIFDVITMFYPYDY